MPKISIVMPAFNSMPYLPITVESVLSQSFKDFELIIVNDGSSDSTQKWTASIKDSRVRVIHQENKGMAAARNAGIACSQGKYIAFLDSDDLWGKEKLNKQVRLVEENPNVGLVYTWVIQIDRDSKSTGRLFDYCYEGIVWQEIVVCNFLVCGSTPLIRRECFEELGKFDPNIYGSEDSDMWIRIASHYEFAVVKEPLVFYRQHSGSVSRALEKMEEGIRKKNQKVFENIPEYINESDLEDIRAKTYGLSYIYLAWRALQSKDKNNYETASIYSKKALSFAPNLLFSQDFVRLNIVLSLVRLFGFEGFKKIQALVYGIRGKIRRAY